jgi:hypothetical protein
MACISASRKIAAEMLSMVRTLRRLFRPAFLTMSRRNFIDTSCSAEHSLVEMDNRVCMPGSARVVSDHYDRLVELVV